MPPGSPYPSARALLPAALLAAGVLALCATTPARGDFANYWTAASLWAEGADLSRLYDYRWFTDQAARAGFGDRLVGFPVLTPPSVLFAVPLLPLGLDAGEQTWRLLQGLLAVATGLFAARAARLPAWTGMLALLTAFGPLAAHAHQGQFHLPAVVALAGGLWAWTRHRDVLAGVALGLAAGLKLFAWPALLFALAARRWRVAGAGALTLAVGGAASVALVGGELHATWLREILPAASAGFFMDPWHPGLASLPSLAKALALPHPALAPPTPADLPAVALLLPTATAFAAALAPAALRLADPDPDQDIPRLAAACVAALATGPMIARYSLLLLLPPALLAGAWFLRRGQRGRALAIGLLTVGALWAPSLATWPEPSMAGVPRAWAVLGLFLALIWPPAGRRQLASLGAALGAALVGLAVALPAYLGRPALAHQPQPDGATPLDHPTFPLVASELTLDDDGLLRFSGLRADREDHAGHGWMGFSWHPDAPAPRIRYSHPTAHGWAPTPDGSWRAGPTGGAGPAPRPCDGGTLVERSVDGQQDIAWVGADGTEHRMTTHPGHDAWPTCDPARGRVWFLSDRGVGVRALRLWWVPLPRTEQR